MRLETAIRDFLVFLKRPVFDYKRTDPLDLLTTIKLYLVVFLIEMLLFIPISIILGMDQIPHAMEEILNSQSIWAIAGLAVFVAPLLEELMFRYHLRYANFTYLFLFIVFIALVGVGVDFYNPSLLGSFDALQLQSIIQTNVIWVAPVITIIIGLIIFLHINERGKENLVIKKIFPFVFYLTVFIFALLHISNFTLEKGMWYTAPLMVLPQFILGLYLGYIRVRNNIGYSIFIHAFNNAIPILIFSLATAS